jgi:sRNA-binding regulator protein Hfq
MNSVMLDYFEGHKKQKTELKCFLTSGTMLTGSITACDEESILLKKTGTTTPCLILTDKIISVTPKD